jgi:hypothetical protein
MIIMDSYIDYNNVVTVLIMMYYDVLWCTMIYYDMLSHSIIHYNIVWHIMTYYDILWLLYSMTYYDISWSDILWYIIRGDDQNVYI